MRLLYGSVLLLLIFHTDCGIIGYTCIVYFCANLSGFDIIQVDCIKATMKLMIAVRVGDL